MVATQGLALSTDDFIATLVTEATVHYLDLTVGLPDAPPPDPAGLAIVRRVLEGLARAPLPADWDDITCALKGTGRLPAGPQDSVRLPLFT